MKTVQTVLQCRDGTLRHVHPVVERQRVVEAPSTETPTRNLDLVKEKLQKLRLDFGRKLPYKRIKGKKKKDLL